MNEDWTVEEQALIDACQAQFAAIAAVMQAGGRVQEAMLAAMPEGMQSAAPMLAALGI